MHSHRLPVGPGTGMCPVIPLSHHHIKRESPNLRSGFFYACSRMREGVKNPRQGSTKRQDRRFAQPQAARRAGHRDVPGDPPLSPPSQKRKPELTFGLFLCLFPDERGSEEPSSGLGTGTTPGALRTTLASALRVSLMDETSHQRVIPLSTPSSQVDGNMLVQATWSISFPPTPASKGHSRYISLCLNLLSPTNYRR